MHPVSARELAKYKLDLVGVQEVGGTNGVQQEQGIHCIFSMEVETNIINWEQTFFPTPQNSISS